MLRGQVIEPEPGGTGVEKPLAVRGFGAMAAALGPEVSHSCQRKDLFHITCP